MRAPEANHFDRLFKLIGGSLRPPPGRLRIVTALLYGVVCHALFAIAVLAMMVGMFFGMSKGLGTVPEPWNWAVNAFLILQFPIGHSALLSNSGRRVISRMAPEGCGGTLATTTYATLASCQLIMLFVFWSPSGIIWWQAKGAVFWVICGLYALSWLLLMKASFDAGAEVQSGALGWMSLLQNAKPVFPPMPRTGLFALIRQPIYLAFALTLWTVPVWTPDQLMIATCLTAYCVAGPRLKELRFTQLFGSEFETYKRKTPYMIPRLGSLRISPSDGSREERCKHSPR